VLPHSIKHKIMNLCKLLVKVLISAFVVGIVFLLCYIVLMYVKLLSMIMSQLELIAYVTALSAFAIGVAMFMLKRVVASRIDRSLSHVKKQKPIAATLIMAFTILLIALPILVALLIPITYFYTEYKYLKALEKLSMKAECKDSFSTLDCAWTTAKIYLKKFRSTYGLPAERPYLLVTRDPVLQYIISKDLLNRMVVISGYGGCGELAIAISTIVRDIFGFDTRVLNFEGVDHAIAEVYVNGSWYVLDPGFTTPKGPIRVSLYASYLANSSNENVRRVYETAARLIDVESGKDLAYEHGFTVVNITVTAIYDPTARKCDEELARGAKVSIFLENNFYDVLVASGTTNDSGKFSITLTSGKQYVILVESDYKGVQWAGVAVLCPAAPPYTYNVTVLLRIVK